MASRRSRRILLRSAGALVAVFAAVQLVPYGWRHPNPPVARDAPWPTPEAEGLARDACYACHSNETDWPVYSYVAPMSWLVRNDVEGGRDELNFSTWGRDTGEADDAAETILDGSMPPRCYLLMHPDARLSAGEEQVLADALETMGDDGGDRGGDGGGDDGGGDDGDRGRG